MLERKVESALNEESVCCGKFGAYHKEILKKRQVPIGLVGGHFCREIFSGKKERRTEGRT